MKRTLLLLALLLGGLATTYGSDQRDLLQSTVNQQQLKELLVPPSEWVPYPAYADRAAWEAITGEAKLTLIKNGEKLLSHEWITVRATDYLAFERTGDRKIMENRHNPNCNALATLVLAELAEGKGRFIDQIINGAFYFCEMTSWALSAHTQSIQRPRTAVPIKDQHVMALVSCEMGAMLAWVDHFFGSEIEAISPIISERIRNEVRERIIEPYFSRPEDFWWTGAKHYSNHTINNWNPWCNCNVLQCLLLLEDNPERLAEGVYRTMKSVDVYLNYIKEDGACEEGPAYWGHAAGKLYDYLYVLHRATTGNISLFDHKMVKDMGEYIARSYVGNNWVVNFADASAKSSAPVSLIHRYGTAVGSEEMCQMAAYVVALNGSTPQAEACKNGRDLWRRLESLRGLDSFAAATPSVPIYDFTWYPQTEFCYIRSGSIFLATKGGHNNESHNHNDIGTFSLYVDNSPVLIDAGVGTYTRQTFGKERYSIWTMQSCYHNLPTINGYTQKFGREQTSRNVKADQQRKTFTIDIAGAYPAEAGINEWVRTISVKSDKVVVSEQFSLKEATAANQLHFLSWGEINTERKGIVAITTPEGKSIELHYNAKAFTPVVEVIPQTDPRLSNVWGPELKRLTLTA
ncbi:MAG: heparinase II/III-family protein, partial [Tidjanibacter sp.]|nr:heparinase II/III-family protein [Tidjanibacter sp.]